MAPFSVSQLKDKASSVKSSGSEKFQNVRGKYSSRSSAESSYNHRDPGTKAPPPPPSRAAYEENTHVMHAPPPAPRSGQPPPVRRSTRPDAVTPHLHAKKSLNDEIKWSALSHDDKRTFFGWLDEFFNARGSERPTASLAQKPSGLHHGTDLMAADQTGGRLIMSHPPLSDQESAAQGLCNFFSPSTQWDVSWYTSDTPTPPPLENITDCIRTHSVQWIGDSRTLSGGVLFSDLSACWYTVEWSERTARDTSRANRNAAFSPRPAALSHEELLSAHETYGETIASFAEGYEGTGRWCARGECWDLASEALKAFEQWDYVPQPIPSIAKTHGHLIFEGKAWGRNVETDQAGRWRGGDDRVRRGDIVQWKKVSITERNHKFTLGDPDHTAIIVSDQLPLRAALDGESLRPFDLGSLEVVEQSVHSPPSRKIYNLKGMEAGELWIYRPIGIETALGFLFSEKCPEGFEAGA